MSWFCTVRDFWTFVRQRKQFVLAPILILLILMALFILLAEIPVLTPFIYAIF
ncbi:MAG: DUF5989 family protein [Geopsychrobacter sp.]|nr:DUF5989 family protein [Geopsychrobacter sp.]